jgi:peptidase A4-like protein
MTALGTLGIAPAALADTGESSNWAGYAVHGTQFHTVSGSWRQPAVSCVRGHDAYSAYWVGLGGFSAGSQALEQIGTEADCGQDGRASLTAWYEMVPAASMPIALTIAPGDEMDASVTVTGSRAALVLVDRTRHERFHVSVSSRQIDVSSAEWIVEAPSDCITSCLTLPLADFGLTAFSSSRAQATGGHWGPISDPAWSSTRIRLSPSGAHFTVARPGARTTGAAVPSALSSGGTSFSVAFAQIPVSTGGSWLRRARARRARKLIHPLQRGAR